MIRDTWISDRAKVDRVKAAQLIEPVLRHHPPGLQIGLTAPVKMAPRKSCTVEPSGIFQDAKTFGHDLMPDSIAFNYRNVVTTHRNSLPLRIGHVPSGVDAIYAVPSRGSSGPNTSWYFAFEN